MFNRAPEVAPDVVGQPKETVSAAAVLEEDCSLTESSEIAGINPCRVRKTREILDVRTAAHVDVGAVGLQIQGIGLLAARSPSGICVAIERGAGETHERT